jgi:mRNA interferase RelE/StbE
LAWTIEYTQAAKHQLRKLDKTAAKRILDYLDDRVAKQPDPRALGKALSGPLGTLWRFRIGDFRAICDIQHSVVTILIIHSGHRREVHR